ncbi:MAG: hypothetical protein ACYCX2_02610 [Christensenellales bacterium]
MAIEYEQIPKILKRYSFKNKMKVCNHYSHELMGFYKLNILDKKGKVFPWELDVFAMFSILSKENDDKDFDKKNYRQLMSIFKAIREYIHPSLKQDIPNISVITPIALIQFKPQENFINRLFRYNYFFTYKNQKVNIPNEFKSKFGISYDELYLPAYLIFHYMSIKEKHIEIFNYLINKYMSTIQVLLIDREEYIKKQNEKLPNGIDSSYYAFKYLYPYPFIKYDNFIFLPLPHLLVDSITDSLLNRLTDENQHLRELFGKEVIENYLYEILLESNVYDEVVREQTYYIGKQRICSPDVMVCKDNMCILFDCKAMSPHLLLREMDESQINKTTHICSEYVIRVYKRLKEFGTYYMPFNRSHNFELKNIFGIVVLLEDNYLYRSMIYNEVDKTLELENDAIESNFIRSNIKVVNLRDVEDAAFCLKNYTTGLVINRDDKSKWYDYSMNYYDSEEDIKNVKLIKSLDRFQKSLCEKIVELGVELISKGIITIEDIKKL